MHDKYNIKAPLDFKEKLKNVMQGIYDLLELSKEQNLEPVTEDGCRRYMEEHGKTCSQVADQFDRPSEYIGSLLDMVRVNFETIPLSFSLNSNMDFLYGAIPTKPFQLGYISIVSGSDKPFHLFWEEDVVSHIEKCKYSLEEAAAIFAVASTGTENLTLDFVGTVSTTLNAGFTSEDLCGFFLHSLSQNPHSQPAKLPTKQIYAGFCTDSALDSKIRLSVWLIL